MPSHIFTRVGYWKESIAANTASVRAAKAEKEIGDQLHGQDYLVYAYLQLGEDTQARSVVDEIEAARFDADAFGAGFAQAASPARYMMERGDWTGAANLEVRPSKFPHVMAITYFARAVGAARSGDTAAARADAARLVEIRDQLREAKNGYWAGQVDVQAQTANAWILYADGKYDDALKTMSAAADAEDKSEKAPVTPGAAERRRGNCMDSCCSIAAWPGRRLRRSRPPWRRSRTASMAMSGRQKPRRRSATWQGEDDLRKTGRARRQFGSRTAHAGRRQGICREQLAASRGR